MTTHYKSKNKAKKAQTLGNETLTMLRALDQMSISIQHLLPIVHDFDYYEGVQDTISALQHDLTQVQTLELAYLYPNMNTSEGK